MGLPYGTAKFQEFNGNGYLETIREQEPCELGSCHPDRF